MGMALKCGVAAIAAALLVVFVDIGAAFACLSRLDPGHALAAAGLVLLTHWVNALKLGLVLPERSARSLFAITLATQAYTLLLPGQIAGEAAKAYRLGVGRGDAADCVVSSVMFDKLTGVAAGLLVTLAGLTSQTVGFGPAFIWLAGGALVGLAAAAAVLGSQRAGDRLVGLLRGGAAPPALPPSGVAAPWPGAARRWVGDRLGRFLATWRTHARAPRRVLASLTYGVASQCLAVASVQALALGVGVDVGYGAWCVVIGALTIILLVPVTIGGLGVRELSLVGLLGLLGVARDEALAVALLILAFQAAVGLLGLAVDVLTPHDPPPPGAATCDDIKS